MKSLSLGADGYYRNKWNQKWKSKEAYARTYRKMYAKRPHAVASRKAWYQSVSGKYYTYRLSAKVRGLIFNLTLDDFKLFWQIPCSYCGSEIKTIGLDRLDNDLGYTIENVVSCCKVCNRMKGPMNRDEFLKRCKTITEHL